MAAWGHNGATRHSAGQLHDVATRGWTTGHIEGIQPGPERLVGLWEQMAVAVQGEADRSMTGASRDLLGVRPSRNPQRHRRMAKVMDAQPVEAGRTGRRPPHPSAEPVDPQSATLR